MRTASKLNKRPYVMVMVSDMKRSVRFYRDTLGLNLRSESAYWTEFETGGATVALHGGGVKPRATQKPSSAPDYAATCSLGFVVNNLDRTYKELRAKRVRFVMAPTVRRGEGIRLAVCLDPDGLPVSLSEHNAP
jgi:catechol 2,3-dioxygenase-like lactoylglutathione lyase family enzyme